MKGSTLKSYTTGFVFSVALTLAAYVLAVDGMRSVGTLVAALLALAFVQLGVQMYYFLPGSGQRWNLGTFLATVALIAIVVGGSIWIMDHLNYRMMSSPTEMQRYIQSQQGF
jgi:cytochrome o ubiquinol oxidase operon protein cyoD